MGGKGEEEHLATFADVAGLGAVLSGLQNDVSCGFLRHVGQIFYDGGEGRTLRGYKLPATLQQKEPAENNEMIDS